jgi:hypothetical protein
MTLAQIQTQIKNQVAKIEEQQSLIRFSKRIIFAFRAEKNHATSGI